VIPVNAVVSEINLFPSFSGSEIVFPTESEDFELFGAVAMYLIYAFVMLIYVSTQAIMGSRVYALYGNKKLHLIGLTFLCGILPLITYVLGLFVLGNFLDYRLLIIYNLLGFSTDLLFLLLILAHVIRTQSSFGSQGPMRRASLSTSLGRITASGTDILSLMVSDSLKYYSITLMMYVVTFATLGFHVNDGELCNDDSSVCILMGYNIGYSDVQGLITFMTLLTGILAPRLLLNIRKEFYNSNEAGQGISAPPTRRTITWRVAKPAKHTDSYELGSVPHTSFGEPAASDDGSPEPENSLVGVSTPRSYATRSDTAREFQGGEIREVRRSTDYAQSAVEISSGSRTST